MEYARWVLMAGLGFALGWFFLTYLTVHPVRMGRALTLTLLSLFLILVVAVWQFSGIELALAAGVALFGVLVGYVANARIVLGRDDPREIPELTRRAEDTGEGHTAVVYFTHGEPETYDPIGWLNQFREFDEQGIAFVPFIARPFFLYNLRKAYLTVGSSQHRQRHLGMAQALDDTLVSEGYNVRVYPSFLDDDPRPDAALIRALNEGASDVVVAEVFVSISNHTAEGEEQIEEVDTDALGVPVSHTGPLWDSDTLHQMFLDKVEAERGDVPRERVGVLLVGHGQPDEWDVEWPTETEHELELRHGIIDKLVEAGYDRDKIDLAWMEFKKPYVPDRAEEIAKRGIDKLVYFSTGISAESLHSQYDVPELVEKATLDSSIEVVNLGAWNEHPLAIAAIAERVTELLPASAKNEAAASRSLSEGARGSRLPR